ncbi:MAG TPA: hypothetical protein VFB59_04975 [Candidatus Saccharimonadales bacterium]|nr:hypothetical protein [Candidatus Saccharimonadales bacterium]
MALVACELSDVPDLAVNVPANGTHGYEELYEAHRDHWADFAMKAADDVDAIRNIVGQDMSRLLTEIIEGEDVIKRMHEDDPGGSARVHRLGLMAMSFYLQEVIRPSLVMVDVAGSDNPPGAIINYQSLEKGYEFLLGYQVYIRKDMTEGRWYRGDNGLFVYEAPIGPIPPISVRRFIHTTHKNPDFSGMTATTPYLASREE